MNGTLTQRYVFHFLYLSPIQRSWFPQNSVPTHPKATYETLDEVLKLVAWAGNAHLPLNSTPCQRDEFRAFCACQHYTLNAVHVSPSPSRIACHRRADAVCQVAAKVADIASAFKVVGLKPKGRVGIFGGNCPEWMISMQVRHPDLIGIER